MCLFWMRYKSVSQCWWVYWESLCILLFIKCWPCLSGNHLAIGTFALQSNRDFTVLPFAPEICFSHVASYDLISLLTILGFKQNMEARFCWCKSVQLYRSQCNRGILHRESTLCRLSTGECIRENGYASKFINYGKAFFNKQRCDPA